MTELSVIIPAFRPRSFEALARSMAGNADVDAEWILVDDGSGPEYDVVFAALPDGITVMRQPQNRRQGAARNAGLAQAQGKWIKFLDADDELDAGHLASLLNVAESVQDNAIAFAPTRHVFADGHTVDNESWRGLEATPEAQLARLLHAPFLHHCGALFPRDLLERLGGYEEGLLTDEDGDLLIRVLMAGYVFVPVQGVHYLYVHHNEGDRVSSDGGSAKLAARLGVCDRVEAAFADSGQGMPQAVRHGLALRLDKIALSYWHEDRAAARAALERARALCPGYRVPGRWPLRILRALGGPDAVLAATEVFRSLRGRPKGGMQG
jgi:glycosyltransferase involved in cell wall biosynthesis